uniref:F-box domain-containing protein n=1 Tax=Oryza brachyantha TaxID=4533 RepID=J3LMP0_ORYBR
MARRATATAAIGRRGWRLVDLARSLLLLHFGDCVFVGGEAINATEARHGRTEPKALAVGAGDLLISEVLSRLPVKSIMRFRSVCCRHLELSHASPAAMTPPVLVVHTRQEVDPDGCATTEDMIGFHRVRPEQADLDAGERQLTRWWRSAAKDLVSFHCVRPGQAPPPPPPVRYGE